MRKPVAKTDALAVKLHLVQVTYQGIHWKCIHDLVVKSLPKVYDRPLRSLSKLPRKLILTCGVRYESKSGGYDINKYRPCDIVAELLPPDAPVSQGVNL